MRIVRELIFLLNNSNTDGRTGEMCSLWIYGLVIV